MFFSRVIKVALTIISIIFVTACVSTKNGANSLSADQNTADLYLQMGVRYLEMDMLKTAKERLESGLALEPDNAEINNALGVLHERLQEYDIAQAYYQQATQLDPDQASIKNNYGRFLCDRGSYEQGLALLQQATAMPLNNRKWFAYTNIGRCELMHGQKKRAEGYFRQALQVNPGYAPALFEMQQISYQQGQYLSARAFLERYLAVSTHTAETLWIAVQTERLLGNQALAEKYQEQLLNQFPTSKQAVQLR